MPFVPFADPRTSFTPPNTPADAVVSSALLLDDPDEWTLFSRPLDAASDTEADVGAPGRWESQLLVGGMYCAACALVVEQALLAVPGVITANVSAASGRASVTWSAAATRPSRWLSAPLAAGYSLVPASDGFEAASGRQDARLALWRWLVAGFCMMQIMMYAAPSYFSAPGDITPDIERLLRWASWVISLPLVLFSCGPFFSSAWRDLVGRRISMDLPVAIGIGVTFAVSTAATFEPAGWWGQGVYFDSLSMFVFFLLTGRWLEQRLRERTAGSLGVLMQRLHTSVERQTADGQFERIATRRLRIGNVMRVLPGEAFAADGTVVQGDTMTDEALLTGESRPIARSVGAPVMAGSYNLSSVVLVRVDQLGTSTRYGQIVALMGRAALEKPRLAVLADRVAKPFLQLVLVAAAGSAAFWWPTDPAKALMAAVAVLVVTCPCALSLATPTAMLTTAGLFARQGVLVRRLQAIESLAGIDTVIFDKTGTLTDATLGLGAVITRPGFTDVQALGVAAGLAGASLHPASRALVQAAQAAGAGVPVLGSLQEQAGKGLQGWLAPPFKGGLKGQLRLGSAAFCGVTAPVGEALQVWLADDAGWMARFDLVERARPGAAAAVAQLQAAGLDVRLLSGDHEASAQRLGAALGIAQVRGQCTPAIKLACVQALQQAGARVLMVGDGLNDGPVLAVADVSVAIGMAVPLAQAQSDFVLPGGQLSVLPALLEHAHRTLRVVRQNLWWAAAYNAVCVPLAVAGWLPAWLAGLGMALSSLAVLCNAARLSHLNKAA